MAGGRGAVKHWDGFLPQAISISQQFNRSKESEPWPSHPTQPTPPHPTIPLTHTSYITYPNLLRKCLRQQPTFPPSSSCSVRCILDCAAALRHLEQHVARIGRASNTLTDTSCPGLPRTSLSTHTVGDGGTGKTTFVKVSITQSIAMAK